MALSLIKFLNIIFAALLAGTSFGIWFGLNPIQFSASTYVEVQQSLVLSLNSVMIILVVLATLITSLSAFLQREHKTIFFSLLIAAALFVSCILITRLGNVPIQNEILKWNKGTVPTNWTILRDSWWWFHIVRTVVEIIALILISWTTVLLPNGRSTD